MPWNPAHEIELEKLATQASGRPRPPNAHTDRFVSYANDLTCIVLVYVAGFNATATEAVPAAPELLQWTRYVGPRSPALIGSLVAAGLCAAVEGFVTDLGDAMLDAGALTRLRSMPRGKDLPPDDAQAKTRVLGWLTPSAKRGAERWVGRVEDVFGVKLPVAASETLADLIAFRNRFAHEALPVPGPGSASRVDSCRVGLAHGTDEVGVICASTRAAGRLPPLCAPRNENFDKPRPMTNVANYTPCCFGGRARGR